MSARFSDLGSARFSDLGGGCFPSLGATADERLKVAQQLLREDAFAWPDAFAIYSPEDRQAIASTMISLGADPYAVRQALDRSGQKDLKPMDNSRSLIVSLIVAASVGASAFHGYRRHHGSIGWAVGWGVLGMFFPILTPAVALAQGFSRPK